MNLSSYIFVILFFILFNKAIEGKGIGTTSGNVKTQGVTKKKPSKKESGVHHVDVSELLADMIQKDEDLVAMTKKKIQIQNAYWSTCYNCRFNGSSFRKWYWISII